MPSEIASRNNKGFSVVFLLVLPTLIALLALIYHLVYLVEFKNEFRFKCISESFKLQKALSEKTVDGLEKATEILEKLKNISTPIKYSVRLSDYPRSEPQSNEKLPSSLVYELNYTWIENFYLKCGVMKAIRNNEWNYEIIYSTDAAKY